MTNRMVAVKTDGGVIVHIRYYDAAYLTLCMLDDIRCESDIVYAPPSGAKVDCLICIAIWDMTHTIKRAELRRRGETQ